jgi:hypothetical protein
MKNAGRAGLRIGACSNGPHPTNTRSGAVWMKAKSRDIKRDCMWFASSGCQLPVAGCL